MFNVVIPAIFTDLQEPIYCYWPKFMNTLDLRAAFLSFLFLKISEVENCLLRKVWYWNHKKLGEFQGQNSF